MSVVSIVKTRGGENNQMKYPARRLALPVLFVVLLLLVGGIVWLAVSYSNLRQYRTDYVRRGVGAVDSSLRTTLQDLERATELLERNPSAAVGWLREAEHSLETARMAWGFYTMAVDADVDSLHSVFFLCILGIGEKADELDTNGNLNDDQLQMLGNIVHDVGLVQGTLPEDVLKRANAREINEALASTKGELRFYPLESADQSAVGLGL